MGGGWVGGGVGGGGGGMRIRLCAGVRVRVCVTCPFLAAVSRRDLCYVSENEGVRFLKPRWFCAAKMLFWGNRLPEPGEPAAHYGGTGRPAKTNRFL